MATESDLRDLLRGPDPEGPAIDLDTVLRRTRSRRRPKLIAAQALGSLALVAVVGVPAFLAVPRPVETSSLIAVDAAEESDSAAGSEFANPDPPDALLELKRDSECGIAPVIPPQLGWVVALEPATVDPATVAVSVALENRSALTASGTAVVTAVVVVADGVVVGHAFPETTSEHLELAPGEAVTLPAVASFVGCEGASAVLPTGDFSIAVDVEFQHDEPVGSTEPIRSPLTGVR